MQLSPQSMITAGAVTAGVGVALGAFGAHSIRGALAPDLYAIYLTAVQYHMWHALALILCGIAVPLAVRPRWAQIAALLFLFGVIVFSGSLYLLVLSELRAWGMVTPIGGTALIGGWVALALATIGRRA
jgi:uncharacterized membrane protein YgdD (TMEM256/DUF423 family)